MSLFHSESLFGKWLPHAYNPVLFDAKLSRPAGAVFMHHGRQLRPVQDCSGEYGGAVPICRVDALGPEEFTQTPIGTIRCALHGCHTYNNYGGLEVIDVFGRDRKSQSVTAFFEPIVDRTC